MNIKFRRTNIVGLHEITQVPFTDKRGFFSNVLPLYNKDFANILNSENIKQVNLSFTKNVGSIRGLHYQRDPYSEMKIVRCLSGKVWDVVVDIRKDSSTYRNWHSVELSEDNFTSIIVPKGCAHGFQVLAPNTTLLYLHTTTWCKEYESGIRWDDPQLGLPWPLPINDISERDLSFPILS